ncbi:MAG: 50S ribosomal protein L21 [Planctomycetales bacterium]|nr:50S ribosomal protein L21 [Planctomycetales bacterium]
MYAIIADGGRQHKVEEGQELLIDYRDVPVGDKIAFGEVLAVSDGEGQVQLGAPTLSGASVTAEVLGLQQGPKITVQKFRRRKTFRRKTGHRSMYTRVKIEKIAT